METTHTLRKSVESQHALQQRKKTLALGILLAAGIAGALATLLVGCGGGTSAPVAPPPVPAVQALQAADVQNIVQAAVNSVDVDMTVAAVDRAGFVLGVFRTQNAPATTAGNFGLLQDANEVAVALARTGAFFSNDQAPLSSRTVRFISGIHFPPGISNQANAALYGVENINRGCDLGSLKDAIFNFPIDRARSIAGTAGLTGSIVPLPCNPADTRGCAVAAPIKGEDGQLIYSLGISTGKVDLRDSRNGWEGAINPGGVPLYRGSKLIGGVGVTGVSFERAEYAALLGAVTNGRGITTAINFPQPLPAPGAIFIDGLRLPFVLASGDQRPAGSTPGSISQ